MAANSNRPRPRRKAADRPKKPYADFPLTPHASGKWQKKIRGSTYYFGRWARVENGKLVRVEGDGWREALELYRAQADDLHAGRTPRAVKGDDLTIAELCNHFLNSKLRQQQAGDITSRTFAEYRATTDLLVGAFGKRRLVDDLTADDFEALRATLAERFGPVRLGNEIQRVRTVFKHAYDAGLIDKPIRYGPGFKKPSASVLRRHRAKNGKRFFDAAECRKLIDAATGPLKAMVLLGLNCGFGNHDCGSLPIDALDLDGGWIDFPRPKTGIERRCKLWPETVHALRDALAERPEPRDGKAEGLVFVTTRGLPYVKEIERWGDDGKKLESVSRSDIVSASFTRLAKSLDLNSKRGFYTLRHVFRTVADATGDQVAVNAIMGHVDPSMGAVYREHIEDARLEAVAEHVRAWLFPNKP